VQQRAITREIQRLSQIYQRYQYEGLNEAETCAYLIDSLLTCLGWDTTNPEIGRREHPIAAADSDVYADYSFFDCTYAPNERKSARVRMFVEAKRVSHDLAISDHGECQNNQTKKWLEQVAFYGVVKGARWLVLMNGHQLAVFRPSQTGKSVYSQGLLIFRSFDEMLARVDDLLLLTRENVWSGHIDSILAERQNPEHQIPTPRTHIRALFEAHDLHAFFDDKARDFLSADRDDTAEPDPMFYQGVNASWRNILANQDVIRPKLIDDIFRAYYLNSNICVIRSESGQGKTTLMFRFAHEYRKLFYILELRQLSLPDARLCELGVRHLETVRQRILILVDDITRYPGWIGFLQAVTRMRHVKLLATTREDEWAEVDLRGLESRMSFVSPRLDRETARLLFEGISSKGFNRSSEPFHILFSKSRGRLLEFVTLITQGGHLKAILEQQVSVLRHTSPTSMEVLRYVSFFHTLGLSVEIESLEAVATGNSASEILCGLDQLANEFVIRRPDGTYEGLHELRSRILTDILHSRFYSLDDTLRCVIDSAQVSQLNTLIKNLPLIETDIWSRSSIARLLERLQGLDDPIILTQCIKQFNAVAMTILAPQIAVLIQFAADAWCQLEPEQFVLGLHEAIGTSHRWQILTKTDQRILEQIPPTVITHMLARALPYDQIGDTRYWSEYRSLSKWGDVASAATSVHGQEILEEIVRSLGEFGEDELHSFLAEQTDPLGVMTVLEVFEQTLFASWGASELLNDLDWYAALNSLSWEEKLSTLESVVDLEQHLDLGDVWRENILGSFVYELVGWDPPTVVSDYLDDIGAIDDTLRQMLEEHPDVLEELERAIEYTTEEHSDDTGQRPTRSLVSELSQLAPNDIAASLRTVPARVAVGILQSVQTQSPIRLSKVIDAAGIDGLTSIGKECTALADLEDLILLLRRSGKASADEFNQRMSICDVDLIIARATMREEERSIPCP